MEGYNNAVIFDLISMYGNCEKVLDRTCPKFNDKYPALPPVTKGKFRRLHQNFCNFGSVKPKRPRISFITDNQDNQINVLAYFYAYPRSSIRAASLELDMPYSTIQKILDKHKMHPFSFIRLQKLRPTDYPRRIEFCENLLFKIQESRNILSKILWTDEAKFTQSGVFNRRNRHFWARENPKIILEKENQFQMRINVFCLLFNDQFRFYLYNENLNSAKYMEILNVVVEPFLDELPSNNFNDCWYQMDGAPAHNTREVDRKLTSLFEDRWWGNRGPWRWPARSPDLTPLDFYLWGRIKEDVYTTPPENVEDLRLKIVRAFNNLNPQEIRRATLSVERRLEHCLQRNGGHIEHL